MEGNLVQDFDHPIRLSNFEGPLDLLLYLIRRNEIDIYDIPIETVTRQYLNVLHKMEELNLEVAGDFFVMAATLMYIKSRLLLPRNEQSDDEPEEDGEDPRWALVQQLIEYRKFKEMSVELESLITASHSVLPRQVSGGDQANQPRPLKPSDRIELWNTFNTVLRRLLERMTPGEIHDDSVTVADRMGTILERLETTQAFTFSSLFDEEGRYNLNMLVATFLAVLELTRLRKIDIRQDAAFGEIFCSAAPEDPTAEPAGEPLSTE
ncbi:MAG: segregation and condensation protein A [Opitutales bacterium]